MDVTTIALSVGLPALGGVIWLVRLEGRVNTNEVVVKALREDVTYIRERIDTALNGHAK